ncbi:hypothetical protein [Agrobacterium rosae]|uniref:hypothetical protein n=1 Tax=Agrobacterium rosae TaxID=1972867 RepID=UPI003B9FF844
MEHLSAPLEGVVVVVVDTNDSAQRIEKALSNAGAAVFTAHNADGIRKVLETVSPHFAVIDPAWSGDTGPQSAARMLFDHYASRLIVYSHDIPSFQQHKLSWMIDKEPVSAVIRAVIEAVEHSNWVSKGGDDVKPTR